MKNYTLINDLNKTKPVVKFGKIPKHFPPASNEWTNSVYSYETKRLVNAFHMDNLIADLCNSYFGFYYVADKKMKSKRMRSLIRKLSTKRVFVSKPHVKQTSDAANITLFIYDRENAFFKRKLFYILKQFDRLNGVFYKLQIKRSKRRRAKRIYRKFGRIRIIKQDLKKLQIYEKLAFSLTKKKLNFTRLTSYYCFFKWALSIFSIELTMVPFLAPFVSKDGIVEDRIKGYKIVLSKNNFVIKEAIGINSFDSRRINNIIIKLNKLLWYVIHTSLQHKLQTNKFIRYITSIYSYSLKHSAQAKLREKNVIQEFYRLELLVIRYFHKLYADYYFKFDFLLPGLKNELSKFYSKKISLTIIKLKYLYLNSDNLSYAITSKLRKKTSRILKVIRRSLKLTKLPKLNIQNVLYQDVLVENKDQQLDNVSSRANLIPSNLISNIKKTFSKIKYKWMTGIRVEGKGRLTKRYTASRALFKYKYKGNLKNIEFINYIVHKKKSQSVFMFRGDNRPNVQHTFAFSKKRIGSFGIKTWLSSN